MKKHLVILMSGVVSMILFGCAAEQAPQTTEAAQTAAENSGEAEANADADAAGMHLIHSVWAIPRLRITPLMTHVSILRIWLQKRQMGMCKLIYSPMDSWVMRQQCWKAVRWETLDFLMANGANTAAIVPELGFLGVCYLFDDEEHIAHVADDEQIFDMYTEMIDAKNLNIKLLNLMGNGMRHLYTTTPVENLDDLKGMKIRVMPSAVDTEVWNTLGANATTVAFSEVYSALQTHMVDGAENTFSSYAASKHNEVARAISEYRASMACNRVVGCGTDAVRASRRVCRCDL